MYFLVVGCVNVYVFDKVDDDFVVMEVVCYWYDLVVVVVFFDDYVDFDWCQVDFVCYFNVMQYFVYCKIDVVYVVESCIVDVVKVDCYVVEISIFE